MWMNFLQFQGDDRETDEVLAEERSSLKSGVPAAREYSVGESADTLALF